MPSILLTAPAAEPLSLVEAKAFLRVEHGDDDDVIAALIASARIHVEAQTRRAMISQTWRITRDAWPADGRLAVRPAPLQALTAVRVFDIVGDANVLDTQSFVIDKAGSQIVFAPWAVAQPGRIARRMLGLSDKIHAVDDGVLGAARRADARALLQAICDERLRFLKSLKTWPVFGKGWARRVEEVRAAALAMASKGAGPPHELSASTDKKSASRGLFHALAAFIAVAFRRA